MTDFGIFKPLYKLFSLELLLCSFLKSLYLWLTFLFLFQSNLTNKTSVKTIIINPIMTKIIFFSSSIITVSSYLISLISL